MKMRCRLSIWLCRRWFTLCVCHLVLLSWMPIAMPNGGRKVAYDHQTNAIHSYSRSSAGMALALPMTETHKCSSFCRCELSLRKSAHRTNSGDDIELHSLANADNYKVKVNCYRQNIRDLQWTPTLSSLTVQL